jgi:hypothetical protein
MKCIYQKITKYEYSMDGKLLLISDFFAVCSGSNCPAFNINKCLKADAEFKNGQVRAKGGKN